MDPHRRYRIGWLAAAVAVVALIIVSLRLLRHESPTRKLMRSAAVEDRRPIEGRLTGFAYSPRPDATKAKAESLNLRAVAGSILEDPHRDAHTAAVASLLYGNTTQALRTLETLVAQHPKDADVWNDLAVARLDSAAATDDVRSFAMALAAADHAIDQRPAHAEALFNRALALDALGLRFAAVDAWQRYLSVDASSEWASEARDRLALANQPTRVDAWKRASVELERALDRRDIPAIEAIVATSPLDVRAAVETIHLPAWADAYLAGDPARAEAALTRARLLAAALKKHNGDGLLEQVVRTADGADAARAFREYRQGRADNIARKVQESLDHFINAERDFAAAKNPMELSAAYFRANALVDRGREEEAGVIATQIETRLDPSYRSLQGHLLWLRGRLTNNAGRHYESFLAFRAARERFEQLGEHDYADRLRSAEAAMLARLGRDREAWQSRRTSLAAAAASGRWNLIETAIDAIVREEIDGPHRDAARSLLRVQLAAPSTLPLIRFNAFLWLAYLDAEMSGQAPDMRPALNAAARIPDSKQREDSMDELHLAEGIALERSNPPEAKRLLSEVIDYRTRRGLATYLPSIHVRRARIFRELSEPAEAENDLRQAIELIESRRERIRSDTLRDAFLGYAGDAYEDLGDLLLSQGRWEEAFTISERVRGRVFLDRVEREPMSADEIAATMPASVVGAHFTSFPARTLVVVIERGRVSHSVIDASRDELRSLRDKLISNPGSVAEARRLYDLLFGPLRDHLSSDRTLVIAPDETTYGIPFAALRDSVGHFLVETTPIAVAPTGAAITETPQTLSPSAARATIVADPAFSTTSFPTLERLPAAGREVERLRGMFSRATALIGDDATSQALAAAVVDCDVLHIASHALSSPRDASLSLIALTPSNGDEGLLHLSQIESLPLRRRPLVVLAGCETASFGGGTGSIRSLAHGFLAAGSRAVLATLWNVGDESASDLTERFYRRLAGGARLPQALREAQLEVVRTANPREWAAFQLHLGVNGKPSAWVPLKE